MFNLHIWMIYIGFSLGVIILLMFVLGVALDLLFMCFKKVECNIEEYDTYSTIPNNIKTDFPSYNLKVRYSYIIDGQTYTSTKLNHYNSVSRNTRKKVVDLLNENKNSSGKNHVYVCPLFSSYSIIFPLKFPFVRFGFMFLSVFLVFLCFCYFVYGIFYFDN